MSRRFDRLISQLAETVVSDRACNQYSRFVGDLHGNAIRRRNLRLYLDELDGLGTNLLLIGEAPSHRGGRLTGIPFVSETVLLNGAAGILGEQHGYRRATTGTARSTEASATMVWGTIAAMRPLPLLWNAFPFHPFQPGNPRTNRMPAPAELLAGEPFIRMLLRLFDFREVLAVGNHASRSLTHLGIPHEKLRHPSMGGKQQFVSGLARRFA